MKTGKHVVAISGSLRSNSSATFILKNILETFPDSIDFTWYQGLANLPQFDGSEPAGAAVTDFRRLIAEADGVIICQPEYAFGIAGSLKNALDWTVSSGEFTNKPVALITAATGGDKAHAALLLVLKALSSKVDDGATFLIPFVNSKLNRQGEVIDEAVKESLTTVVNNLMRLMEQSPDDASL